MTSISTEAGFKTWATSTGGTGTLTQNITLTAHPDYPLLMINGCNLDGDGYLITIASTETDALFRVGASSTVSVKDVKVIVSGTNMTTGVIFNEVTTNNVNITVTDCAVTGSFAMSSLKAGIVSGIASGVTGYTINITGCYCTGNIGSDGGGIFGANNSTSPGVVVIDSCYTTGNIGTNAGGIAGRFFASASLTNSAASIRRCYTFGNIAVGAGGIVGRQAGAHTGMGIISNCYSIGTITGSGAGILGIHSDNRFGSDIEITNCYSKSATTTGGGDGKLFGTTSLGNPVVTSCGAGSGEWGPTLGTNLLDDEGSPNTNVWITAGTFSPNGYGLTRFKLSPWDGTTYLNPVSQPSFIASGGAGDPHIITLNGEMYDLITNGIFNLFDNNCHSARLVINANVFTPPFPIWQYNEYINDIFIHYKGWTMIVNAGFRGKLAKIIYIDKYDKYDKDDNFDKYKKYMTVNEYELKLCNDHKMFCSECKYRTTNYNYLQRHHKKFGHIVLENIRNKINIIIKDEYNIYNISISNVNNCNFNPANINIKLHNTNNINEFSGAIVKKYEQFQSDIQSLNFIK
jgi:hypothetical protein